jgi:hypothetical protein
LLNAAPGFGRDLEVGDGADAIRRGHSVDRSFPRPALDDGGRRTIGGGIA